MITTGKRPSELSDPRSTLVPFGGLLLLIGGPLLLMMAWSAFD